MRVALDAGEMAIAHFVATMRRCVNQSVGVRDQRREQQEQAIATDMRGMIAEIAWHKHVGTYPDLSIRPRAGSADAVINGKRVDIKSTHRRDGKLLATVSKSKEDVDVFVLAIVNEDTVDFVGWATADELLSPETIIDLGYGPTHAIPQERLRPFKE